MKKNIIIHSVLLSLLLPVLVFAQPLDGVKGFLAIFGSFINTFIKLIFGLAMIYFFWGTAQFILHAGDVKVRTDGKNKMIWGVIALFVLISIYGILTFIGNTLGIGIGGSLNATSGIIQPGSSGGTAGGSVDCPPGSTVSGGVCIGG